jgi:hypothetical protein
MFCKLKFVVRLRGTRGQAVVQLQLRISMEHVKSH